MSLDQIITALIYLVAVFAVFLAGKWLYDRIHSSFDLKHELVENDNFAVSLAVIGYYLGIIFALGGILAGPSAGWLDDVLDIVFYGLIATVLLNLSGFINDKIILAKFDNTKEIITDKNAGTGIVVGATYIATGLIIAGALSGEGGDLITGAVFWILGQAALVIAGLVYNFITPFDIHDEIEKDNVAVGVAFAGVIIAIGVIAGTGVSGDFISWQDNLSFFGAEVLFGLITLPIIRLVTDKLLLPGQKLTDELVNQEKPNVGAGAIEAFSYIAASMLISWVI
jgi:uncharacterized membrane protein YjfL (UPF0719 family)